MQNAGTILREYYDAVVAGDLAKARTCLADDMTFVGLFETYPNADAYMATFTQLMQIVRRLDIKVIIGEGDNAAIFMEMETAAPAEAVTLVAEWHRVENAKIVYARSAFDGRPFAAMFSSADDARKQGGTHDILHRVGVNASPEAVYNELASIEGLRAWWVTTAGGDPAKGGTIDFGFCKMLVLDAEPGRLIRWRCTSGPSEWLDTEVTFRLEPRDGQTFIIFKHANWKEPVEFMHHCSTKWGTFLLSLRDALESGAGRPAPHDLKIHLRD
ncbi:MAG TPA: nuclear transport factor 2 family protein [Candidatus Kapabacteria bacterium]|nr:nuclear transport factor 2 family protein [Candidatus Kapabacteria bacterium]